MPAPSHRQPVTDADSPPQRKATRRAISTSGSDALTARTKLQSKKISEQVGSRRWGMHGLDNEANLSTSH